MNAPRFAVAAAALVAAALWLGAGTRAAPDPSGSGAQDWSGDFRSFYLPNAEYVGARLARGELPLWNPRQAAGQPFLATLQPGALYPPNALHALLPAPTAFLVLAALHVALAACLAGAFAAALGAGAAGSALAGLAYAGSVQVAGGAWSPPVLYTAAWAPGLLLLTDRLLDAPSVLRTVGFALALALALLAGWPYAVAITALGAALYALAVFALRTLRERRPPLASAAALGVGVLAGLALAGPQLVATWELLPRSCRALGDLVEAQAIGGGVRTPHEPATFWLQLTRAGFNDGVPGWPALLLSVLALLLPGAARGRTAALLAAGGVGLLASFPYHTPVYEWLRELPVYADFRFPFRYRLLPALALSVGAGVGLAHLMRALRGRAPAAAFAAAGAALLLQVGLVSLPTLQRLLPLARSWPAAEPLSEQLRAASGVPPGKAPLGRIFWAERAEKLRDGAHVLFDLEPMSLARTAELLTFFETGRPRTLLTLPQAGRGARDTVAPPYFGKLALPETGHRARILDLFSVTTVAGSDPPAWLEQRYRRRSAAGAELAVFDNPHALPRAYRVEGALPEPASLRAGLRLLTDPRFDPRRLALLDAPPPGLIARPQSAPAPGAEVEVLAYTPERIRLRTDGSAPGVVVLTDAYYPGWEARVDGEAAPVLRANLAFRGVPVPAGAHEVELRYRPDGFRSASVLSLAVLTICAGASWRSRGRWRPPGG